MLTEQVSCIEGAIEMGNLDDFGGNSAPHTMKCKHRVSTVELPFRDCAAVDLGLVVSKCHCWANNGDTQASECEANVDSLIDCCSSCIAIELPALSAVDS